MKKAILWIMTLIIVLSLSFVGISCKDGEAPAEEAPAEEAAEPASDTAEEDKKE